MSAEEKKIAATQRITGDLSNLNSTNFELVAHALLREIEGIALAHRGLATTGNPAGYTVDSLSPGGSVVGEYGTDDDYFRAPFIKVQEDVRHALKLAPLVQRIDLMSNQPCTNSDLPKVQAAAANIAAGLGPEAVQVWSQREIADELYHRFVLPGREAVSTLASHLPEFARLLDEEVYEFAIPRVSADYVRDELQYGELSRILAAHNVVQLAGVSGTGKTMLAADWVRHERETMGSVLWLRGDELPAGYNFRGVRAERFGVRLNLVSRIAQPRSLLVVDDFRGNLSELLAQWNAHVGNKGRLLLTSQIASPLAAVVKLFGVAKETARQILPQQLSEAAFEKLYEACGGVPRALTLCGSLVACGTVAHPDDLVAIVQDLPLGDAGEDMLLWQALLTRHLPAVSRELGLLQWFRSQRLDETFLTETIGKIGLRKLLDRTLLQSEGSTVWKVHDLVWRCLPHLDLKEMTPLATQLFGDYVARHAAKKQRHVRLTLSLLAPRIAQLRPEVPEHGLWSYAYLELDQCEETPEFIDALALAPAPGGDEWAAWAAWIEAKERLSRTERAPDDFVEASALLLEGAYAQTSNDRAAAALAHHAGKFYARLDRYQDARRCFDLALSRDASYPEVLLAKARVARKTRAFEQGAELVEILLNERYINGVSVGLAAYAELVSYPGLLKEWVIDQIDDFIGFVDSVRVDGFAQPEQTIRAVCRGLEYSAPEIVVRLSRSVELPTVDELQNDRDRAGWAEQYLIYASSLQKIGEDYTTQAEVACAIFEACSKLDTFGLSRYAKCLLLAAKPEKAVTVLQQATDPFCRFYLSQSLYAVGEVAKAEQVIDKLVDESQSKPDRYTWDFYRWRGRIKERAGKQGEALSSFRSALNKCPGDATHDIDDIKRSISAIDPSGAGSTSSEG